MSACSAMSATDGVVPDLIVRSWRRSISISADSANPAQRFSEIDTDSILCRAADPVLDRWQVHLADTGTSLFLSDRAGASWRAAPATAVRAVGWTASTPRKGSTTPRSRSEPTVSAPRWSRRVHCSSQGSQHYNDALADIGVRGRAGVHTHGVGDRIHLARRARSNRRTR